MTKELYFETFEEQERKFEEVWKTYPLVMKPTIYHWWFYRYLQIFLTKNKKKLLYIYSNFFKVFIKKSEAQYFHYRNDRDLEFYLLEFLDFQCFWNQYRNHSYVMQYRL